MLGKLLKYELPAMGRKLLPLYAAWLAAALLLGLSAQSSESETGLFIVLTGLVYGAIAMAIFVMMIILIVQRYSNSLLGDEAYFNHVLPVSVSAHIGNKAISALVWTLATGFVALLTAVLIGAGAVLSGAEISEIFNIELPKRFIIVAVEMIILIVAGTVKTIMQIYTAVTVGHQVSNHTTLASIGAYILVLIFESMIGRLLLPLFGLTYGDDGYLDISSIFITGLVVTLAFSAIYFFVCKYLMEKRLDLA